MHLSILLFGVSCVSIHRVGKWSDYNSAQERIDHAHSSVTAVEKNWIYNDTAKVMAMRNVGILQVVDQTTIDGTIQILHNTPEGNALYSQTIWSLGEMGRYADWENGKKIHEALLTELARQSYTQSAQYTLEAMGKTYCQHPHTVQENMEIVEALHQYLARSATPADMVFVLLAKVQTLDVLVELIHQESTQNPVSTSEIYIQTLELTRYYLHNRQALQHPSNKVDLSTILQTSMEIVHTDIKSAQLLALWCLAEIAEDSTISENVVQELLKIEPNMTGPVRLLWHYALLEMLETETARKYLRKQLEQSSNPELYTLLYYHNSKVDAIQQLYGISVQNGEAQ